MQFNLLLTEKPSVARSIAAVLNASKREDGFFIGNGYIVSYCFGHLLGLAVPEAYGEQYAKWRYADLPIIPDQWIHTPAKDKTAQLKILAGLLNRPDVGCVINACDAGREGELIFRLVYEYAKCKKPIKRLEERYDGVVSDDYVEAIREVFDRVDGLLQSIETERTKRGLPIQTLSVADCIPGSMNECLTGKTIVIKPEALAPEYRAADYQLKVCTGGFGAESDGRGSAVFCKDLYSGKESRYERRNVAGVIDPDKLPDWAAKKIAMQNATHKLPHGTKTIGKPVSLLGKLDDKKQQVERDKAKGKRKPSSRKRDNEVKG
jgi:hypothetical protein